MIEGVPVGVMSLTTDGHIEFINQNALSMLALNAQDAIGKQFHLLLSSSQSSIQRIWAQLRAKPANYVNELSAKKNGGEEFPVEFSLADFEMIDVHVVWRRSRYILAL